MILKQRKIPVRTCIACRQGADKRSLVRFVRDDSGHVFVDVTGKAAGRGAYLHSKEACFSAAQKSNALARALKVKLDANDYESLAAQFAACAQNEAHEGR